jgi:hypothetical protein
MQNGWNNAKVGLATGAVDGFISGLQRARAENVNPLTGNAKNVSQHATQRINERTVSQSDINDALKNPLKVTEVNYDAQGRPSVKYIGNNTTVIVNPDTGKVITVYPTSTQRVRSILKTKNK